MQHETTTLDILIDLNIEKMGQDQSESYL
jgi:hypothetical protein